jgi:hypothetical protein
MALRLTKSRKKHLEGLTFWQARLIDDEWFLVAIRPGNETVITQKAYPSYRAAYAEVYRKNQDLGRTDEELPELVSYHRGVQSGRYWPTWEEGKRQKRAYNRLPIEYRRALYEIVRLVAELNDAFYVEDLLEAFACEKHYNPGGFMSRLRRWGLIRKVDPGEARGAHIVSHYAGHGGTQTVWQRVEEAYWPPFDEFVGTDDDDDDEDGDDFDDDDENE